MEGRLNPLGGCSKAMVVPPLLQEVGKLAASVASVNTSGSGSATGNPRNKCALTPGHSLMDWIRLGSSGKDLTHVGPLAGKLNVTSKELAKHRSENDAWLAIRGKVFNVTDYLSFHPGGVDQIMQGVGRDCTELFDSMHPWVNFEKILSKCYIGVLSNVTVDEVIVNTDAATSNLVPDRNLEDIKAALRAVTGHPTRKEEEQTVAPPTAPVIHKQQTTLNFDWVQKAETLMLFLNTSAGSNPYIQISPPIGKKLSVIITCRDGISTYNIEFLHQIEWPVKFKINYETSKIEILVIKLKKGVWTTFGTIDTVVSDNVYGELVPWLGGVTVIRRLNYNCVYFEVTRKSGILSNAPLGQHVKIFNKDGESRSYSPIPCCMRDTFAHEKYTTSKFCFLVKRYPDGLLSTYITSKKVNEEIEISDPIGSFQLKTVLTPTYFIMLAAGTGLNPLLGLVLALFERRIKPVFQVEFVLSKGSAYWKGLNGHVSAELIKNTINKTVPIQEDPEELFILACGSTGFGQTVTEIMQNIHFNMSKLYVFPG